MTTIFSHSQTFEVPRHLHDVRLDTALFSLLQEKFPEKKALSRSFLSELIRQKKVMLNSAFVKPSALVVLHDIITLLPDALPDKVIPENLSAIPVETIFEDNNIIVINKPPFIKMHASGVLGEATLSDWIVKEYPELKTVGEDLSRPGIVHRLDRETSGVVVLARNNKSFQELKNIFQEREIQKTYVALVYGNFKALEGKIDLSLTRKSGEIKRKAIDATSGTKELSGNVRTALTHYRVIARYKKFDLVEAKPKTGRTHQIRVHLAALGHPVVGDKLYAFKPAKRGELLFSTRHLLHASAIAFTLFGQKYSFQTPLPADFRQILADIDESLEAGYDDRALKSLLSE